MSARHHRRPLRAVAAALLTAATLVAPAAPPALAAPVSARPAAVAPAAVPGATGGLAAAPVKPPKVGAAAYILVDAATGQTLLDRRSGEARAMASTTKVMTGLLAMERLDLDKTVVIGTGPSRIGEESLKLRAGERWTVRELLHGLLMKSANDSAVALAEAVDGTEAKFVRRMNAKARSLGMTRTKYVNSYGLDRPGHATSARDLARVWTVAMRRPEFRKIVGTRTAELPGSGPERSVVNTNQLLGPYPWMLGGKTGFTDDAGRCLVASAERGGRRLVAVALGSENAFPDVRALLEYGFSDLVRARLVTEGAVVSTATPAPAATPAPSSTGAPAATAAPGEAVRVGATVDALVRRDLLGRVRVSLRAGSGTPTAVLRAGDRVLASVAAEAAPAGTAAAPVTPRALPAGAEPAPIDPALVGGDTPSAGG